MKSESKTATLELRDIHLPESGLWWPPAPGWWIVLFFAIATIASIFFFIRYKKNKRLSAMFLAKQELNRIESQFMTTQDKSILIRELSELIRRVSISLFQRNESASLTGKEWLLFLDELNGDESFSKGSGRVLIEAPYQANPDYDEKELLQLISRWIDSVQDTSSQDKSDTQGIKS